MLKCQENERIQREKQLQKEIFSQKLKTSILANLTNPDLIKARAQRNKSLKMDSMKESIIKNLAKFNLDTAMQEVKTSQMHCFLQKLW